MISIESDLGKNTYEIHSMSKAFFPHEDVRITDCDIPGNDTSHTVIKAENCGKVGKLVYKSDSGDMFEIEVPADDRDELKRTIYRELSLRTGISLPWGSLTGIRPTGMVRKRIESGMSDEAVMNDMRSRYYISQEKLQLAMEIAKREIELMRPLSPEKNYSLYVDIPFCPTRCLYCSFTSNAVGRDRTKVEAYLGALKKEIKETSDIIKNKKPDTIYIGGGTPTALLPEELDELLSTLKEYFDTENVKEYTVEAGRPDSITVDKLRVLKKHRVTRISVNPQTMNQKTLEIIGRRHTVEQVAEAFHMARGEGFDNINMDMILGLPGEDTEDVKRTVSAISELGPDALTIHTLALKRASIMKEWLVENGYPETADTAAMMDIACRGAREMGMKPYYLYRQKNMAGNLENTGYATEGKYGIYNILINEEVQDILALGAGAISKRVDSMGNTERSANFKEVHDYIAGIDEMIERKRRLWVYNED